MSSRKSLYGGHAQKPPGFGGEQRQQHRLRSPVWEEEEGEDEADSPTRRRSSSSRASRVRAKHTELPDVQSPKKVTIVRAAVGKRSRADRRTDVQTEAEVEPLRAGEEGEEQEDFV